MNRWDQRAKKQILVLGDSHAEVFSDPAMRIPGYAFRVISVSGATISGLKNPNSSTQARTIFDAVLEQDHSSICLVLLGEVDTGFVIWHQAQKYHQDVDSLLHQTVMQYQAFLRQISHNRHTIVMSAPLPTIEDGQDWGKIANARKEVQASQKERTRLTLCLNRQMQEFALQSGISCIDLDPMSLAENGCVKKQLLHPDPHDHHYDPKNYIQLIRPELTRCLHAIACSKSNNA